MMLIALLVDEDPCGDSFILSSSGLLQSGSGIAAQSLVHSSPRF